jgi:two-component system OmpR family sensor kinase
MYFNQIKQIKIDIVLFFTLLYSIIALIGLFLAKLFIKPLKDERDKLNNFIKDTTHELNTPISAILMSTEENQLTPKQIERIRLSAKRVSEIYKDLTYIFLENDLNKKDLKEISLVSVINEELKYFEPLANKKRVKIDLDMEEYKYKILKDDFIRLFNNIVSNAIKYNKMDGSIFISLKENKLIIKDNGIGIKEDKIGDIFKRYNRATSLQGGFGLGLNIVYEIAKKYNIKIEIDSIYNIGTTITLKF